MCLAAVFDTLGIGFGVSLAVTNRISWSASSARADRWRDEVDSRCQIYARTPREHLFEHYHGAGSGAIVFNCRGGDAARSARSGMLHVHLFKTYQIIKPKTTTINRSLPHHTAQRNVPIVENVSTIVCCICCIVLKYIISLIMIELNLTDSNH